MSTSSVELYEQHRAREKFLRFHDRLRLAVAMGDARRHIDPLLEACEDYLERCGDNSLTTEMRAQLARTRRVVECRYVFATQEKAND